MTEVASARQSAPSNTMLRTAIDHTRSLTLTSRESVFSLEFSALHFAAPQRNMFAYRLEGFDRDWVMTDAGRRFATYTNLDPGEYVFRVKAANKDGIWNLHAYMYAPGECTLVVETTALLPEARGRGIGRAVLAEQRVTLLAA